MKCPKCKAEIDNIDFDVTASCSGNLNIKYVKLGCLDAVDLSALEDTMQFDNFRCPECQECLFTENGNEEDQAIKFLKGEE